jgi:hypothetical protein
MALSGLTGGVSLSLFSAYEKNPASEIPGSGVFFVSDMAPGVPFRAFRVRTF